MNFISSHKVNAPRLQIKALENFLLDDWNDLSSTKLEYTNLRLDTSLSVLSVLVAVLKLNNEGVNMVWISLVLWNTNDRKEYLQMQMAVNRRHNAKNFDLIPLNFPVAPPAGYSFTYTSGHSSFHESHADRCHLEMYYSVLHLKNGAGLFLEKNVSISLEMSTWRLLL